MSKNNWGGRREGAGRPLTAGELRKLRSLRATEHEWQLILRFAKILKYGDKASAEQFIDEHAAPFEEST